MKRNVVRDRWRAEVLRSARISDSVRVVLLVLADTMTEAGYVSVPRSTIAKTINRTPRRVTERLELARDAGYLAVVRPAMPRRTAEYVATLPDTWAGAPVRTSRRDADGRTSEGRIAATIPRRTSAPLGIPARGADGGPPNTRALTTATEERTDKKTPARLAASSTHPCARCGTDVRGDYELCGHCYRDDIARARAEATA